MHECVMATVSVSICATCSLGWWGGISQERACEAWPQEAPRRPGQGSCGKEEVLHGKVSVLFSISNVHYFAWHNVEVETNNIKIYNFWELHVHCVLFSTEMTRLWNLCPDNVEATRLQKRDFIPSLEDYFTKAIEQIQSTDDVPIADRSGSVQ